VIPRQPSFATVQIVGPSGSLGLSNPLLNGDVAFLSGRSVARPDRRDGCPVIGWIG
jgi:hypothetical protein